MSVVPIPSGARVLLDTVALIYFLERHSTHGPAAEEVLRRIEQGQIAGLISALVFAELLVPLYRAGDTGRAKQVARRLMEFRNLETVVLSPDIAMEAARLRADHGLRTPDAIHAATAVAVGADGILTNDTGLGRLKSEGLLVWTFDSFRE